MDQQEVLKSIIEDGKEKQRHKRDRLCFDIILKGYFKEINDVDADGVYVAFARNIVNPQEPKDYRLVYIGIGNIKGRVNDHIREDYEKWAAEKCYDPTKEEIVYSYCEKSYEEGISELEKAFVYKAEPCYNKDYSNGIESDHIAIQLNCKGDIGNLQPTYNWLNPKYQ